MADSPDTGAPATQRGLLGGLCLLLAASVLWSLSGALIKLAHQAEVDGVTIAFYRSLFAGIVLLPFACRKLNTLARPSRSPARSESQSKSLLGRVMSIRPAALWCILFFTLMTVSFAVANTKTEAANVIILQYTSTFWVFGLSPRLLGEKPRGRDLWILGIAMIGIAIIFFGNAATDLTGLLIALGSGFFFALLTLMIRIMRDSDSAAVTLVNLLGSALLLLPVVLFVGDLAVSRYALLLLVLLGVFQFGLPYYLYTLGLARIKAHQAALITLVEPVLVPLWAYLAVGERIPTTTAVGGAVILAALLLFIRLAQTSRSRS